MNPLSLILIGLGLILVYIGWKGSQHTVIADLLGHPSTAAQRTNTSGAATPANSKSNTQSSGPTTGGLHLPTGLPGLGLGL